MTYARTNLRDFALAKKPYVNAIVTYYTVDAVTKQRTTELADLYSDLVGDTKLPNPQTLDSYGKFKVPVYVDEPVIAVITGLGNVPDHQTGVNAEGGIVSETQSYADAALESQIIAEGAASEALAASAILGAVVTGMDPTNVLDSTAALKAAIAASVARVTTAGNRWQMVNLYVAPGRYKLTDTIVVPSYMSIISLGLVIWDFSTMADVSKNGFDIYTPNQANSYNPQSNKRSVLNGQYGAQAITPPTGSTGAGVIVGNSSSGGGGAYDFREVTPCYQVQIGGWKYGVQFRVFDTYMCTFDKCKIGGTTACIRWGDGSSTYNAGEKIFFNDCVLVGFARASVGVKFDSWNVGMYFQGCSFDFMYANAFYISNNVSGIGIHVNQCWFEKTNNDGLVLCVGSTSQNTVVIQNSHVFPRDVAEQGTRSDGKAIARQYLFKGDFNLSFINNRIQGYENRYYGGEVDQGVYFCDPSVNITGWYGNQQLAWRQLISKDFIVNKNHDFSLCTLGANLRDTPQFGWAVRTAFGGLTATVSNDMGWDGATQSIKVAGGGSTVSGDIIELFSDPIPINKANEYMHELIVWAGETTGSAQASVTMKCYARQAKPAQRIVSITRSGTTATATTDKAHGLEIGDVVFFKGADQGDYNRKAYVLSVPSSTTFTFYVPNSPATPATATSPTVISYEVELGGLKQLTSSIANNEQYGTNATDTSYPRNATKINFDTQTANFSVGDIVTGGTSGATAEVIYVKDNGTNGFLTVVFVSGTFVDNETITSDTGGSALVNGAPVANDRNYWQRYTSKLVLGSGSVPAGTEFVKMFINWNGILNSEAVYMGSAQIGRVN